MARNGLFPDALLTHLGWPEADHLRLVPNAAASLNRLAIAFEANFDKPLYLSDAYRTFDEQVRLKITKGVFAATPGSSNHGFGLAIDMASRINIDGSAEHRWMEANGPYYGWINPWWAENYIPRDGQHEPWHWEYRFALDRSSDAPTHVPVIEPTPITPTVQEDDMLIIESPGALWTLTGDRLTGIADIAQANRLTDKGIARLVFTAPEFKALRETTAGRELIVNDKAGYAVGILGGRYIPLGDIAEVQVHQNAGCRQRTVSEQTFRNLTA